MIHSAVWKYDRLFTSAVVLLPATLQPLSSKLGKVTLPSIWATFVLLVCGVLTINDHEQLALTGIIIIASIPIGTILKLLVRRSRPKTIYAQNMKIKSYSFPSSHTYAATVAGGYMILVITTLLVPPISLVLSVIYAALIVAIGISRIHVGAHYPTDVTAGWILGAAVLYAITQFI